MKTTTKNANDLQLLFSKLDNREPITFDELLKLVGGYIELSFYYHKKQYGITQFKGYEIYEWNKNSTYQTYKTIEEFANKATIDGVLLKDAYPDIEKLNYA